MFDWDDDHRYERKVEGEDPQVDREEDEEFGSWGAVEHVHVWKVDGVVEAETAGGEKLQQEQGGAREETEQAVEKCGHLSQCQVCRHQAS